jgi:hypothetical protein
MITEASDENRCTTRRFAHKTTKALLGKPFVTFIVGPAGFEPTHRTKIHYWIISVYPYFPLFLFLLKLIEGSSCLQEYSFELLPKLLLS